MKKIFIMGSSRSGTTLMGRILGANDAVLTFHEMHFFEQLWDPTGDLQELSRKDAEELAARLLTIYRDGYYTQKDIGFYLEEAIAITRNLARPVTPPSVYSAMLDYETANARRTIPCVQTPRNIFYLQEILTLFPQAYAVHMIRDPRDVLLSQKKKWRRSSLGARGLPRSQTLRFWANYHPVTMSILWNSVIQAANAFREHPRFCQVRFEDLIANPEPTLQSLCGCIGLSFVPAMLEVQRVGSSHRADQSLLGFDHKAAQRWKDANSEHTDLFICELLTRKNFLRFGYEVSDLKPNAFALLWAALTLPFKVSLAFLLNAARVKNIGSTLKRRLLGKGRPNPITSALTK